MKLSYYDLKNFDIYTGYKGPWQAGAFIKGDNSLYWYILNTKTRIAKRIGRVRFHGVNYLDIAKNMACARNASVKVN